MEWERQRRDQLVAEKLQEQSTVDQLSVKVGQLRQELQVLVSETRLNHFHQYMTAGVRLSGLCRY